MATVFLFLPCSSKNGENGYLLYNEIANFIYYTQNYTN